MQHKRTWGYALLMVIGLFLTGCHSSSQIQMHLKSASQLNAVKKEPSSAVVIRLYLLSDETPFSNASFHDLWKDDQRVLGSSLVLRKELTIKPNYKDTLSLLRDDKARFVGVVALFRHPDGTQWRVIQPIKRTMPLATAKVSIVLSGNRLQVVQ